MSGAYRTTGRITFSEAAYARTRSRSIPPVFMSERGAVELIAERASVGEEAVHEGDEALVVMAFEQMDQLMDEHVLDAHPRFLRQLAARQNGPPACSDRSRISAVPRSRPRPHLHF